MIKTSASFVAAGLILAGAVGDHIISSAPSTAAQAAAVKSSALSAASATLSVDAATEHAFGIASPSVVYVDNVGVGSGSGVIYDTTGDIVTNAHVVAGAQSLRVTLTSGKTYRRASSGPTPPTTSPSSISTPRGLPAAHFAAAGTFSVAQTVLAIGSPLGLQQSVTSGLISALNRTVQEANGAYLPNAIQTSAPINPGNSGGALVTLDGTVVGIPTLEATDPQNNNGGAAQGIGFAVPSTRVTFMAHQIIATGRVAAYRPRLPGCRRRRLTPARSSALRLRERRSARPSTGRWCSNVAAGSPADRAGVQQGDVITAVNGQQRNRRADLLTALAHAKPGADDDVTLNRNGSTLTVHAHLGELSAA